MLCVQGGDVLKRRLRSGARAKKTTTLAVRNGPSSMQIMHADFFCIVARWVEEQYKICVWVGWGGVKRDSAAHLGVGRGGEVERHHQRVRERLIGLREKLLRRLTSCCKSVKERDVRVRVNAIASSVKG